MYSPQVASNTGPARCRSRLLRHSPLRTGYVRFYCFPVQFPLANPVEVPPAPSAVRRGGAPDARSSTRVFAQGQPLCWARCPCVVIPLWVIPHLYFPRYGSPHGEPVSFPGRDLLPSLLCIDLTPGWLSLPQRLPYVVLPSPVHMCNLHMVPALRRMWLP